MHTYRFHSFIFFIALFLLTACGSRHGGIRSVDPRFHKYVAAYSSGIQSRTDKIYIELQATVDSSLLEKNGKKYFTSDEFFKKFFKIRPHVQGKICWKNERTIEFTPKKPLESNTLYTIAVQLDQVTRVEPEFETFHFQVATHQQRISMKPFQLKTMDDYNLHYYTLEGKFTCSDLPDSAGLSKILTAKLAGKNTRVKLGAKLDNHLYTFYIDSIPRSNTEQWLSVKWNGQPIHAKSKGTNIIKVPALNDINVVACKLSEDEDQMVSLTFSEPISTDQTFDGLVTIEGIEKLNFGVTQNSVNIFLPARIEGVRKITVYPGIKNIQNTRIKNEFSAHIEFHAPNPSVRIQGQGSILPDSKGLIFPFETIALNSVTVRIQKIYENNVHHFLQVNNLNGSNELLRFGKKITEKKIHLNIPETKRKQWTQHVLNLEKWIRPEQGAIYRIGIKFDKSDAVCDCPTETTPKSKNDEKNEVTESWSEETWESYYWDEGYDNWSYDSDDSPCHDQYYRGKAHSRNILASNIGILFKLDENKTAHAFLTNLINAQPLANAQVDYVDYTKQIIRTGTTNSEGMLTIKLPRKPFLLVAKYAAHRGYLKLGDGYANSMSKFDVEGERVQHQVKGFIYGERGVWRPGDSLFLNFVLQDPNQFLPKNHPVRFTLTNSSNQVICEQIKKINTKNHFDFRTATTPDAPTGIYVAEVTLGKLTFKKHLRIETVKPNRLKMALTFPVLGKTDSTEIVSSWLHGSPAKELIANVDVEFKSTRTIFSNFSDYIFDSPVRQLKGNTITAFNGKLNAEGKGKFKLRNRSLDEAPGFLRAIYTTRVFEKGGNYSIDRFSTHFSPFKTYVGLGIPNQPLINGKKHTFRVVTVNENGNSCAQKSKLHVRIYRMKWRWWYEENEDNQVNFLGRNGSQVVFDTVLHTHNGASKFNFGISAKDYGRFLILVTDENGKHQTGEIVTIDFPSWSRDNSNKNEFAAMLEFSSNKALYSTGEEVTVNFPSPAVGKALISIETNKRVVKKFWINTSKGETSCTFQTTREMAPNAYIHVTLLQAHATTVNDLPIRMYGVIPIRVDDPNTHLYPTLKLKPEWRPQSVQKITVGEKNSKSMIYTLAIVDDGLLDLTRFKTPNPWTTFYAREALGVRTWDMYGDVIGAYSGKLDRLLSIGGDDEADDGAGPKANRFKPMVRFLGPFYLKPGEQKTHQIDLPAYVGSARVMVVAHNERAYGCAEETVTIKKPLMVLATLPRVIGPGENIVVPVNVFALDKTVGDVKVEITTNDFFQIANGNTKNIDFKKEGDAIVDFEIRVAEKMGVGKIKITATTGRENASHDFEIDVRSANPVVVETKTVILEAGKSIEIPIQLDGIKGSHEMTVEMSRTIPINLSGRLTELINYPFGCIEQTTSTLFPQLLALETMDCSIEQRNKMVANIQAGLFRYPSFQTTNGGLSYWPRLTESSAWGSNYAGHFLLEAEQKGFSLPVGLKNKWLRYQQDEAKTWENDGSYITHRSADQSNQLIQAYRLFTLALAGKADLSSMNRMREIQGLSELAQWRLAAAYHLAGQLEIAQQIISHLSLTTENVREMGYTYGSELRNKAMILEACQLINPNRGKKLALEIANHLSSKNWLSTQETAFGLIALCATPNQKSGKIEGVVNGIGNPVILKGNKQQFAVTFEEKLLRTSKKCTIKNTGNKRVYVAITNEKVAARGDEKTKSEGLKMEVSYTDFYGKAIHPRKLIQGTDFKVTVKISNPSSTMQYREMSLQQIFPSGWEIHNTRFMEGGLSQSANYQNIKDDRVETFFNLAPLETKIVTVQLNASYKGRFYLPAVYSHAMYDNGVQAIEKGFWVEVVSEK